MDKRMEMQQKVQSIKEEMVGFRYRHFKGGVYIVSNIAVHSETEEPMVIYKSFDNPTLVWARPLSMFLSEVDHAKYPEAKQKFRFERMDGEGVNNNLTSEPTQDVTYWESPMPLEKQWTLCDEAGILKGNILMDKKTLFEGVLDDDEVLDLMSERLTGDPGMTDMHFEIVDTTPDDKVVVCVRGSIAERDEFTEELETVCAHIKSAVIKKGSDAISDFLGIPAGGKTKEELEQAVEDAMNEMQTLTLIQHFKKYVVGDAEPEATNSVFERLLAPERIGIPDVDSDFAASVKQDEKFPITGLQFCPEDYMTSAGFKRLMELLNSDEFEPLQIDGNANTSSYFLISSELYAELEVADVNEFEAFVREILDDIEKENSDNQYMWRDHRVYLGYL